MDIISKLIWQLSKIKSTLLGEIQQGKYTYNYLICEEESKFLDNNELQTYISTTKVANNTFLLQIANLCSDINIIWNGDLQNLEMKVFAEPFYVKGKNMFFNSTLDFQAIYLHEDTWTNFNTLNGKKSFVEKYNFINKDVAWISGRCVLILNWITASYPDIKKQFLRYEKENIKVPTNKIDNNINQALDDYLFEFDEYLNLEDYNLLRNSLYIYFTQGVFPTLTKQIKFKKINKKRVGWVLNNIFRELKPTDKLSIEYLNFAKENINIFEKTIFDKENYLKSNLYKYFTQKP